LTRIAGIDVTPVSVPFARPERWAFGEHTGMTSLIVELRTESGLVGIGEIVPGGPGPEALRAAVGELAPLLIGRDARDVNANVARMLYSGGWYMFERTGNLIVAGLEMAMWDVLGKSVGEPVHRLLGGKLRDRVPYVYYLQAGDSPEAMAAEAARAADAGFETFFFKGGWDERRDVELVAALRDRLGSRARLRLDANEAWTVGTATRMLRELEPLGLELVEQPVRMDDVEALLRLRRATAVPIAANQSGWTAKRVLELVRHGAADAIVTDPHQEGGLAALRRTASICEAAGLPIAHHAFSGLAIAMTAALHVYAVAPNCTLAGQAYAPGFLATDVTRAGPFDVSGGFADVPGEPGLGVELDGDLLAAAHGAYLEGRRHPFFDSGGDITWMPRG
jgi:L-alanine-DL-glutamate epimerase-like enolase superfamily enzyme